MEWFSVSLVPICTGCWETISALGTRQEYTEVARKIRAEVILTAKAISAEHKLKSGGK